VPWKGGEVANLIQSIKSRSEISRETNPPEELMAYREIVARIYGDLHSKAVIRLRDTIVSKTNNSFYIFDVTIRAIQAGQEVLTAVNVYPGKALVDEQGLLAFANSLEDVGAAKGVMVCNAGFTQSAKSLASGLGVDLTSVQDAQSRNWRDDINIPVLMIDRNVDLNFHLQVYLDAGAVIPKSLSEWQFTRDGGQTAFSIVGLFTNLWNRKLIPTPTIAPQVLKLDGERLNVWIGNSKGSGSWTNATGLRISYKYRETGAWVKYFRPDEYLAIQDRLSENIQVTRLEVELGPFVRDKTWTSIKNPDSFKRRTKGVLVVVKPVIEKIGGGFKDEGIQMERIDQPTNALPN
jgi:hypothetical protein